MNKNIRTKAMHDLAAPFIMGLPLTTFVYVSNPVRAFLLIYFVYILFFAVIYLVYYFFLSHTKLGKDMVETHVNRKKK